MFPTLSFGDSEIAPADLAARAAKTAGFLASIGLADGDTFAVMLRNQPKLIEIMLAARQLGAYFVPLNWHFTATEASFILRDSGAKLLIIGGDLLPGVADAIPVDMPVYRVGPLGPSQGQGAANGARDWNAAVEDAQPLRTSSDKFRGMVPYTSGTTGQPKGVRRIPQGDPTQVAERIVPDVSAGARGVAELALPDLSPALPQCANFLRVAGSAPRRLAQTGAAF